MPKQYMLWAQRAQIGITLRAKAYTILFGHMEPSGFCWVFKLKVKGPGSCEGARCSGWTLGLGFRVSGLGVLAFLGCFGFRGF